MTSRRAHYKGLWEWTEGMTLRVERHGRRRGRHDICRAQGAHEFICRAGGNEPLPGDGRTGGRLSSHPEAVLVRSKSGFSECGVRPGAVTGTSRHPTFVCWGRLGRAQRRNYGTTLEGPVRSTSRQRLTSSYLATRSIPIRSGQPAVTPSNQIGARPAPGHRQALALSQVRLSRCPSLRHFLTFESNPSFGHRCDPAKGVPPCTGPCYASRSWERSSIHTPTPRIESARLREAVRLLPRTEFLLQPDHLRTPRMPRPLTLATTYRPRR
jgi:hypothetical protein